MILRVLNRIIYRHKATSETYVAYLKSKGVMCGEGIRIFVPHKTTIDVLNPHLLSIGSNVVITGPTTILTHDYSVSVANRLSGGRLYGKQQPVSIGSNVFIGWGSIILPGSTIENNVIIGAGAVISGRVETGSVYAGNPAQYVCSIETYMEKRAQKQLGEAVVIFKKYRERYGKIPDKAIFHEYFYLFSSEDELIELYKEKMRENGNYDECLQYVKIHKPVFETYESFCEYAGRQK